MYIRFIAGSQYPSGHELCVSSVNSKCANVYRSIAEVSEQDNVTHIFVIIVYDILLINCRANYPCVI